MIRKPFIKCWNGSQKPTDRENILGPLAPLEPGEACTFRRCGLRYPMQIGPNFWLAWRRAVCLPCATTSQNQPEVRGQESLVYEIYRDQSPEVQNRVMGGKKTEGGANREHPAQLRLNRKLKNNTEFWLKYMGLLELNSSLFPISNKRHHLPSRSTEEKN